MTKPKRARRRKTEDTVEVAAQPVIAVSAEPIFSPESETHVSVRTAVRHPGIWPLRGFLSPVIVVVFVLTVGAFLGSWYAPYWILGLRNVPLSREVSPDAVTGVFIASAVVFGLSTLPLARRTSRRWWILFVLGVSQVVLFMFFSLQFMMDYAVLGRATFRGMSAAVTSLLWSGFSWILRKGVVATEPARARQLMGCAVAEPLMRRGLEEG
jgi:hypothetical protein